MSETNNSLEDQENRETQDAPEYQDGPEECEGQVAKEGKYLTVPCDEEHKSCQSRSARIDPLRKRRTTRASHRRSELPPPDVEAE
jgi:hypothetical protein